MDRFIVEGYHAKHYRNKHLKSNMDRFIECKKTITQVASKHLKSNMDRFIEDDLGGVQLSAVI